MKSFKVTIILEEVWPKFGEEEVESASEDACEEIECVLSLRVGSAKVLKVEELYD